jgi:uncharacterized protein (UPF0335 family)
MPGAPLDKEAARALIHGMPADEWKAKYQSEATPEQLARMEESLKRNGGTHVRREAIGLISTGPAALPLVRIAARSLTPANRFTFQPELPHGRNATDDRLRLLIERVERLEEEKKGIADDIKDVYAEAKAVGYDAKIMRQIVRLRKMPPDDRAEMEAILDVYKAALGLG